MVSERRACEVLTLHRSTYRYRHRPGAVDAAHQEVVQLSERYDYWGYRKIHDLLHRAQVAIGRERVRLIRRREGLQVQRKRLKRGLLGRSTRWVHAPSTAITCGAMTSCMTRRSTAGRL